MEDFFIHHNEDGSITLTNLLGQTVTKSPPLLKRGIRNVYREPPSIIKKRKETIKNDDV